MLHEIDVANADSITDVIKMYWLSVILRNGVVTQIQTMEPKAIYTHCYGDALNLAARDIIKKCLSS